MDEIPHGHDSVDVSRIIAEKDSTKGCECAHEIRCEGYWGLDSSDIGRGREMNATPRHDEQLDVGVPFLWF